MSAQDKANGDMTEDDKVKSPACSQRKLRLNRRGFHLSNHPLTDLLANKSDEKKSSVNGCDDGAESKTKTDSSRKRMISLISVRNSTSEKDSSVKEREAPTTITLKSACSAVVNRTASSVVTQVSSDMDPPPKKKHKPITWP